MESIKRKTLLDKAIKYIFLGVAIICSTFVIVIAGFIFIKGVVPFFKTYDINGVNYRISLPNFLFGNTWFKAPNIYGAGYIVLNTIIVTFLAILLAVPISILTALFIVRIAPKWLGKLLNTMVELLAGIPSVIFGLFGICVITVFVSNLGKLIGVQTAGGISLLSTALVLAIMILPTITTISVTSIESVDESLVLASLALGATPTETSFKVVLNSSKSGITSGIILGVGRALGEATAVSMVCGNAGSGPTFNPFDTTKTLTSCMLQGIHETTSMDYDIRFSVGLLLIIIIIVTNVILNLIKNRIGNINGQKKKN